MKRAARWVVALVALGAGVEVSAAGSLAGWEQPADNPPAYEVAADAAEHYAGRYSARLACDACGAEPAATLMQVVQAGKLRGRRARLVGYLKTAGVREWAGLWMRVDCADRRSASFDNMSPRGVSGTTPWTRYEVVLDVPEDAVQITFGVLLQGRGRVWADALSLAEVGPEVPSTDLGYGPEYAKVAAGDDLPPRPRNLSFEE
jgi:hypothetical protein